MSNQNLLFICSRNQWRSPTGEKVFAKINGIITRSAGTSPNAKRTVSTNDISWATYIFVMESKHKQRLIAKFTGLLQYKKITVLDIPDEYQFMDPELVTILEQSIEPLL